MLMRILLLVIVFISVLPLTMVGISEDITTASFSNNSNAIPVMQSGSNNNSALHELVGVRRLLDQGYDGSGVKIGIIDTGVNDGHPDLQGKGVANKSFVSIETA